MRTSRRRGSSGGVVPSAEDRRDSSRRSRFERPSRSRVRVASTEPADEVRPERLVCVDGASSRERPEQVTTTAWITCASARQARAARWDHGVGSTATDPAEGPRASSARRSRIFAPRQPRSRARAVPPTGRQTYARSCFRASRSAPELDSCHEARGRARAARGRPAGRGSRTRRSSSSQSTSSRPSLTRWSSQAPRKTSFGASRRATRRSTSEICSQWRTR